MIDRWIKLPTFKDKEKTHTARVLIILTGSIIVFSIFFEFILLGLLQSVHNMIIVILIMLVALAIHIAAWRGYVGKSALILCTSLWLLLTILPLLERGRGIYDVAFYMHIVPVLLASFLLKRQAGLIFAVMSTLSGLLLLLNMRLAMPEFYDGVVYWIACSLSFFFAAALLTVTEYHVQSARARIIDREMELEKSSSALRRETLQHLLLQEMYRSIVENSLQGLAVIQKYRVVFANPAMSEILGYSHVELMALENAMTLVHPEDRDFVESSIGRPSEHPDEVVHFEFRTIKADGEVRWIEAFPVPITYHGKHAFQVAFVDITERKAAHDAVKRSQEWFSRIFQSSPLSISISRLPEGDYVDVNPKWSEMFGYSREEAVGQSGAALDLWADEAQRLKILSPDNQIGGSHEVEINVKHRDGTPFSAMISTEIIEIDDKQYIMSMVSDITERKKAEAALAEREETARQFQEKLKALHEVSLELMGAAGFDELCRKAIELGRSKLGFDRIGLFMYDQLNNMMRGTYGTDTQGQIRDERHLQRKMRPEHTVSKLLVSGQTVLSLEDVDLYDNFQVVGHGWNLVSLLPDGKRNVGWLVADNLIEQKPLTSYQTELLKLYGLELGHAITRLRAQESLRRSEKWFSTIFHTAPLAISIGSVEDEKFVDLNAACCELFGYTREEMIGRASVELDVWVDRQRRVEAFEQIKRDGHLSPIEVQVYRRDKTIRTVLLSTEVIDFQGKPHHISMLADITDRKQAEQQRLELALAKERLDLFREFMTNISHDLKTPLSIINTSVELMERIKDPVRQQEKIEAIKEQTSRLDRYIHDMLTMSRLDYAPNLSLRPVDINRIVADVNERLEIAAEKKNIEIHLEMDQQPAKMLADEGELERMLVNLVENALNYTPTGGKVWIRTYTQHDLICVEVRDTGIGIGEKDLPRVFDRFYRADTARSTKVSGTGLGLAIVKRIVEMHSGEIDVQSTLGEGTTFRIQFPAVVESAI